MRLFQNKGTDRSQQPTLRGRLFFEQNGRKGGAVYNFFAAIAEKILLSAVNYLTAGGGGIYLFYR